MFQPLKAEALDMGIGACFQWKLASSGINCATWRPLTFANERVCVPSLTVFVTTVARSYSHSCKLQKTAMVSITNLKSKRYLEDKNAFRPSLPCVAR
jgi:hypothetical protein